MTELRVGEVDVEVGQAFLFKNSYNNETYKVLMFVFKEEVYHLY